MSLMSSFKGFVGETVINLATWLMLDKHTYHRLNNITLPLANGGSTQIDHIIVSIYGIFVIETKHYKGWIFGSERQAQWTQSIMGRKYKFQNPLRQNYLHVKTLAELLALDMHYFHSMIVFIGECEIKTADELPKNVMKSGMVTYIKDKQNILLTEADVKSIVEQIENNRFAKSWRTNRQHKAYLQNKHGNQALKNEPVKALKAPPIAKTSPTLNPKVPIENREVQRWSGQTEVEKINLPVIQSRCDIMYLTPFAVVDEIPLSNVNLNGFEQPKSNIPEAVSPETTMPKSTIPKSSSSEPANIVNTANYVSSNVSSNTSDSASNTPSCPKCNSDMVERVAKKGARQGQMFYGCMQFPKCWGIVNIG
ncbi:NERD domain-containing protein [Psychrobacter sp. 16-MNA-CIBAN-0192]|uniref:NERD domain-containing protein n=1 Tax=Psychrobacter sp. 16-MNA-CIBAN-0192 TaxID=3140448 RepID=UPI00333119A2